MILLAHRYDAAHSADILFILALNLLLWGGVAVLCATLEYNVKVNVCVSIFLPALAALYLHRSVIHSLLNS